MTFKLPNLSFNQALVLGSLLRLGLLVYGEYHDSHSAPGLKYTDIDYRVFSDATKFILHPNEENKARGPLGDFIQIGECVLECHVYLSVARLTVLGCL